MKSCHIILAVLLVLPALFSFSQAPSPINLHEAVKTGNIEVYNREMTLINEDGHLGINLSRDLGEGIAWLKGIEFSNGTIEFDVRGEDLKQHSFVGIAFHAKDNETFDAIYLRPFQFHADDEVLRSHGIQYISLPSFTWQVLREKYPNKFEHSVDPAPDPNGWVHMKVVVKDKKISVYINGQTNPTLVVEKVTSFSNGKVGFYVADTSGGDFANITITKD